MGGTALPNVLAADLPNVLPALPPSSATAAVATGASPAALMAIAQEQARKQATGGVPVVPGPSGITTGSIQTASMKAAGEAPQVSDIDPEKFVSTVGGGGLASAAGPFLEMGADAVAGLRAARTEKLAGNAEEWQRINGVLNVPKTGVIINPAAQGAEEAVKMPGRTVAEMGYTADELQKMEPITRMNVLNSNLQNVGSAIEKAAQAATKAGKTIDLGDLDGSVLGVFKNVTDPAMKAKMLDQFYEKARALGIGNLRQITPEEALALRRDLRSGLSFSGFSDVQTVANISKRLGSAVSDELKSAVPDFVNLDRQYTDLKGAVSAAKGQVQNTLKAAPPPSAAAKVGQFMMRRILPRAVEYGIGGAVGYGGYRLMKDMLGSAPQ